MAQGNAGQSALAAVVGRDPLNTPVLRIRRGLGRHDSPCGQTPERGSELSGGSTMCEE